MNVKLISFAVFLTTLSLVSSADAYAFKVPGYLITTNSDTVYGYIKVYIGNYHSNFTYSITGINLESYHTSLRFKPKGKRLYKTFWPEDIKGFSFIHRGTVYTFHSFYLKFKSIFSVGRTVPKFLDLVYDGKVKIYQDMTRRVHLHQDVRPDNLTQTELFYTYYIYNEDNGLEAVQMSSTYTTVDEMLIHYGIEKEFFDSQPKERKFKDVRYILHEYEIWLEDKNKKTLKT